MSTRKNVIKTTPSVSKLKTGATPKQKITRDQSTDRLKLKKEEEQIIKNRASKKQAASNSTRTTGPTTRIKNADKSKSIEQLKENKTSSRTTTTKRNAVTTPPSRNITKTEYFPSKNLYANTLIEHNIKPSRQDSEKRKEPKSKQEASPKIKSTRPKQQPTLTPAPAPVPPPSIRDFIKEQREKKQQKEEPPETSERPGTATLTKGNIVNKNIVGPEAPKTPQQTKQTSNTEDDYEDDFDSYESDFEAYTSSSESSNAASNISGEVSSSLSKSSTPSPSPSTSTKSPRELTSDHKRISSASTDDEKKLDSGNFELPVPEFNKHKQLLDKIKESIEKENANLNVGTRTNPASLSDEGFEEAKSIQFVNFAKAQKKYKHKKSQEKKKKRGEEILSMIRLDAVTVTLLDLKPVPYEEFIKYYGRSNTIQTAVQTGGDSVEEETQTDSPDVKTSWTQMPSICLKYDESRENFYDYFRAELLGVGGEVVEKSNKQVDENSLNDFLLAAGELILEILVEKSGINWKEQESRHLPFSDGFVLLKTEEIELLKDKTITFVTFCSDNQNKFITAHGSGDNDTEPAANLICLWRTSDLQQPETVFKVFGDVNCCCFGTEPQRIIFAGLLDGSIALWNTSESKTLHLNLAGNSAKNCLRTPTFQTEIGMGHIAKVVAVQTLDSVSETTYFKRKTSELASLDEDGNIIIWSVIEKTEKEISHLGDNQGLAHWGNILISRNITISLAEIHQDLIGLQCTDLMVSRLNQSHIYVSCNYGFVLHCLIDGSRSSPNKFSSDINSKLSCLETCPFCPNYFMSGDDDGNVSLYSIFKTRALINLSNSQSQRRIKSLKWSYNNPFIFYTLDASDTLHIWDLCQSDIYPVISIPFREQIVSIALSCDGSNKEGMKTYMAISTSNEVQLHVLNDEHSMRSQDLYKKDVDKFIKYATRL